MANTIITRDEYKSYAGIQAGDTSQDAKIDLLLPGVHSAIVNETERDFTTTAAAGSHDYIYDGSGILEINDAQTVDSITFLNPTFVMPADTYVLHQQNGVYTWIELAQRPQYPMSPEMGFTFNLDRLWWRTPATQEPTVTVAGSFGWTQAQIDALGDLKQAAYWTLDVWMQGRPDLEAEAIADYSRSFAISAPDETYALPPKARDLLDNFRRE